MGTREHLLEKKVEAHLTRAIEGMGGICIKLPALHTAGIPDRLCILPHGRVFFVELKRPNVKPRALQVHIMTKLLQLGVPAVYLDSINAINDYLQLNYAND